MLCVELVKFTGLCTLVSSRQSFQLAMYQVTDMTLCRSLLDMHNKGIDLTVCSLAAGNKATMPGRSYDSPA